MNVQIRSDNSSVPFIRSGCPLSRDSETIIQDAGRSGVIAALTLMSHIGVSLPITGTADGGNVGDGVVDEVARAAGVAPREGIWELECVAEVGNGGVFKLTDPGGNIIRNDLTMTPGAAATTTFYVPSAGMTFDITDGAEDFDTGDKFTIEASGVGKWTPFDEDSIDGGRNPDGVYLGGELAEADIQAGDITDLPMLVGGTVNVDEDQLVIEGTADLDSVLTNGDTVRQALNKLGIFPEATEDVDNFENS